MFQRASDSLVLVTNTAAKPVRRIPAALTVIALAAVLTACGGGGDGSSTEDPVTIQVQPTEESVEVGSGTVRFSVQATGAGLTFQWQRSTTAGASWADISGAINSVLELTNVTFDQDGHQFRVRISGKSGTSATSSPVSLHVLPVVTPPTISVDLASPVEISEGGNASLSVTAGGTNLTYLWQSSTNGGAAWTDIAGNNAPTLALQAVPLTADGTQYRVMISNSAASVTSKVATLKVNPVVSLPVVTTQPQAVSVAAPAPATFTVAGTGKPTPTVQWQVSASGSSTYTDIPGATSLTYTIPTTSTTLSGSRYRAVLTNSVGSVPSNGVALTVQPFTEAPKITTPPASVTAAAGSLATFKVETSGTPTPTVKWQLSTDGTTWSDINGANSASYTTPTLAAADVGKRYYRAVASNGVGSAATSAAATLTVTAPSSVLSGRAWATGQQLETNDNDVLTYDATIDDIGRVTVIFVKSDGTRPVLYATRGTPNAAGVAPTFSAPVAIDTTATALISSANYANSPVAVRTSPGGNAVATWTNVAPCTSASYSTSGSCYYRYSARFLASTGNWDAPVLVASTPSTTLGSLAVNDQGDVLVEVQGWERSGTSTYTKPAGTLTWKASSASTFSQKHFIDTSLKDWRQHLDKSGNMIVVGEATQNSTTDIVAYRGNVTSGMGAQEILDTRGATANLRGSWSGINGQVVVMWNQSNGTADTRFAATLDAPAGTWSQPTALSLASEVIGTDSAPFYARVTDDGDFVLYRNQARVQRIKGVWKNYSTAKTWNNWNYWNDFYSQVALNRDGSVLIGKVGPYLGDTASWASFDGPSQAVIQAFPASNVASGSGYILGTKADLDGIILLAKSGVGAFVTANTYDVLPSAAQPAGDGRSVTNLWGVYFK